jgi:integrase
MRACEIDRTDGIWLYKPLMHKTRRQGRDRIIALGPKAQEILKPFLRLRCPCCEAEGTPTRLGWQNGRCRECVDRALVLPMNTPPEPDAEYFLFSPREAIADKRAAMRAARKTKVQPSQLNRRKPKPERAPGDCYSTAAYDYAIAKGCKKAGVPHWHPHQLRHAHATEVRRRYGLEAPLVALGHSQANVTQVHAERDLRLAAKVAKEIG